MSRRGRAALGLLALAAAVGCGSSSALGGDGGDGAAPSEAACAALEDDYLNALAVAKSCTPGAANQCAVAIDRATACKCPDFVNVATDTLARAATALEQSGCPDACTGACALPKSATCITRIEGSSCVNVTSTMN